MPFAMGSYPPAVVIKGKMYVGGGWAPSDEHKRTVMEYDPYRDEWATLPQYNHIHFGIAVWNDHLVLVGGINVTTKEQSPILGVIVDTTWKHPFLPMPTARRSPTVVVFDNRWLVVIGGKCKDDGTRLSDVEVLDTISGCWHKCAPLPRPLSHGSATTIGNTCYILGGFFIEWLTIQEGVQRVTGRPRCSSYVLKIQCFYFCIDAITLAMADSSGHTTRLFHCFGCQWSSASNRRRMDVANQPSHLCLSTS